jgi:RNA polymerase sigma-70 factor (ECF subfamily)
MPENAFSPLPDLPDDLELVRAARQTPDGFGGLYLRYVNPVFRYLCSRTGNVQEAEDLTSQTFMAALESLDGFREDSRFVPWLFTIARNKAADHFRKQKKSRRLQSELQPNPVEKEGLLTQVIQTERAQALSERLQRLPEKDLELLRLRFLAEMTYVEMGEVLHRSPDAVKKSTYRLLARLKGQLEVAHD